MRKNSQTTKDLLDIYNPKIGQSSLQYPSRQTALSINWNKYKYK